MDELDAIAARLLRWTPAAPASRRADDEQEKGPWTLELYPTLRCNLSCTFCDTTLRHRPAVDELSAARWVEILEEATAIGARRVMVLGGGEPFVAPSTPAILRAARRLGLHGMLTTNGTLLSDAILSMLVEIAWDEVHFSVDGATAETHDRLRGSRGAFRKTVSAACRLRARRGVAVAPRVAIHMVLTNQNYQEIPAMVRLARAIGAFRLEVDALVAYRPEQEVLALGPLEKAALPALVAAGVALAEALGIETTLPNLLHPAAVTRGAAPPPPGAGEGLGKAPCLKAWHHLTIAADGRTSPCCVLTGEGDSVRTGSLREHWEQSTYFNGIRSAMLLGRPTGRCGECSENILSHERAIRARLSPNGLSSKRLPT